jgi:fatty acid desaturase
LSGSSKYIDAATLKRLSRLSPWRTALAVAGDWAVIAAASRSANGAATGLSISLPCRSSPAACTGSARSCTNSPIIRFTANKKLSDAIGDLFTAWPLLATTSGYRRNHLAHHRYTNTDMDPDWVVKLGKRHFTFPQEMRFAVLNVLGYFVGVNSIRDMRVALNRIQADDPSPKGLQIARLGPTIVAHRPRLSHSAWWQEALLYWVVPYSRCSSCFSISASVAEHFGPTMEYDHELTNTRTVIPNFLEAWFFAPHGLNYHLEHHIYPSVPFYRLGELHAAMMRNETYAKRAHITRGYTTGLLREVWLDSWRRESPGRRPTASTGQSARMPGDPAQVWRQECVDGKPPRCAGSPALRRSIRPARSSARIHRGTGSAWIS